MDGPLVSVIVPCYHCESTIAQCIRSILAQTYPNWEAIFVIDDIYAEDTTYEIVSSYAKRDHRISIASSTQKTSPAMARNRGYTRAQGDHIIFLDSDDWMEPIRIERSVGDLQLHPEHYWCQGYTRESIGRILTDPYLIGISSAMFNRSLLNIFFDESGYVFDPELPYLDDLDLLFRVWGFPGGMIPEVLQNYYLNSNGLTQTTQFWNAQVMKYRIMVKNGELWYLLRELRDTALILGRQATGIDLVKIKKEVFT